ncbi:hypothetical protein CMV_029906 [Castanea mollissima]|uniref:Uncharacterized protein n=1 Tax=Castanea mollissima TaxID=60419 RepID=A0A8J4QDI2_9ROSI|nr:hypothetical protein CMV_029906 [Castanea mollissima]
MSPPPYHTHCFSSHQHVFEHIVKPTHIVEPLLGFNLILDTKAGSHSLVRIEPPPVLRVITQVIAESQQR